MKLALDSRRQTLIAAHGENALHDERPLRTRDEARTLKTSKRYPGERRARTCEPHSPPCTKSGGRAREAGDGAIKVALVTSSMSRAAGGLAQTVPNLARALDGAGDVVAHVFGARDSLYPDDHLNWGAAAEAHPPRGPRAFGWAPGIERALAAYRPSVVDAQGLWMYPSLANLRHARRTGTPYVVTPRGMLDPWALRRARWKKRLVRLWFEDEHLRGAGCLHALSENEARAIRACGLTNPVAIVPNGIELPADVPDRTAPPELKSLLFLGRIDRKKGVEELLRAWGQVQGEALRAGWRLQVTGWGGSRYVTRMRALSEALGLASDGFSLTGPMHGVEKATALRSASAFVLPSYSEGLPMAVLEAWSYGLPALLTDACNLPEGFACGAAWRVEAEPASLAEALRDLIAAPPAELVEMGRAGRALVETRFTWERVATDMRDVYRWVPGGGPPPPCIVTD